MPELFGQSPSPAPADPMAEADARIEQHRKGDATILVVDGAGKPLPGVKVTVEQTRHAFLFGCNIFNWGDEAERYRKGMKPEFQAAYRDRFKALFNFAALPFFIHYYNTEPLKTREAYLRSLATWCRENGITAQGTPLYYHLTDPAWAADYRGDLIRLQVERVADCVKKFAGLIDVWNVVNEASIINPSDRKTAAPVLTAAWMKAGAIPPAKECFRVARQANPNATLMVNDYILDQRYEKVLAALTDEHGKPLYDVIGIQSHMHAAVWSNERAWSVCQQYAKYGVPLHISEVTILSGGKKPKDGNWPSTPEGEALQAKNVTRIYTLFFSHPAVEAMMWWDLADGYAWKKAPAGLLHNDMSPKPAYDALMKLIKGKWWTRSGVTTGADGTASVRGFYGNYKLTVSENGKVASEERVSLEKDKSNQWKIVLRQ
jgi:GH35 family endo-1,4-beta-xylanase